MGKVTLDMETFKALASESRLQVLRTLDERRKTLTEIAKEMQLNKATVHEHLQTLVACELVRKRDDEGRKWIYYELTWRGQTLLHPEASTTFTVLLGLSTAAASGSIFMAGRALGWWWDDLKNRGDDGIFMPPEGWEESLRRDEGANGDAPPENGSGSADDVAHATAPADGDAAADDTAGDGGMTLFLDDGGWLALAFLCTALLFVLLALVLRFRRYPKAVPEP